MTSNSNDTIFEQLFEILNLNGSELTPLLECLLNHLMKIERAHHLKAERYERNDERCGYANGFKPKTLKSRMGSLALQVPQTRDSSFYPRCIDKGCRSDRALKAAIAQMYLDGVSTRRVTRITEELCGLEVSSSQVSSVCKDLDKEFDLFRNRKLGNYPYIFLDATYLKTRHDGHMIDTAVLIAVGINEEGRREVIGISSSLSEAEVHWRTFLESLVTRGLVGVGLIISDDHAGLEAARKRLFGTVPYQRCQFHMIQNAQSYAPKQSMRKEIVSAMREIFACSHMEQAKEVKRQIISRYEKKMPEFTAWFDEHIEEGLTCLRFPEGHRRRIRTTNCLERLNREIKRRVRVAVLFPNMESALRLVTGVVIEIHEEWLTGVRYLDMG